MSVYDDVARESVRDWLEQRDLCDEVPSREEYEDLEPRPRPRTKEEIPDAVRP